MTLICKFCGAEIIPWEPHGGATYVRVPPPGHNSPRITDRWCPDDAGPGVVARRHRPL